MIIRILTEGQFDVPDGNVEELNQLDETLEAAIRGDDEDGFRAALERLLDRVRELGSPVPVEDLVSSDLLLPYADVTLHEVRDLLSGDGLIPGRSSGATSAG